MTLLSLFQWLAATPLGTYMRDSTWGFASVEAIHLLALAVLGGTVLVVDLRLLGLGLRKQPVTVLARELTPWFTGSLVLMLISGLALTSGEAMKCYYHPAFRLKMALLGIAIAFHYTLHQRIISTETGPISFKSRLAAAGSLALWLSVGAAGRAIGLV